MQEVYIVHAGLSSAAAGKAGAVRIIPKQRHEAVFSVYFLMLSLGVGLISFAEET